MQWYSATQVAKMLNAATATVCGLCADGTLGAVNIARATSHRKRWRISEKHLAEFEERRQNKTKPTAAESKSSRRTVQRPTHDFFAKPAGGGK